MEQFVQAIAYIPVARRRSVEPGRWPRWQRAWARAFACQKRGCEWYQEPDAGELLTHIRPLGVQCPRCCSRSRRVGFEVSNNRCPRPARVQELQRLTHPEETHPRTVPHRQRSTACGFCYRRMKFSACNFDDTRVCMSDRGSSRLVYNILGTRDRATRLGLVDDA